jgi:DNA-binding response OmpR family regulator
METREIGTSIARLLVIEDDEDLAQLLTRLFGSQTRDLSIQFTVSHAGDIASAWEQIERNLFDIMIIDLSLPFRKGEKSQYLSASSIVEKGPKVVGKIVYTSEPVTRLSADILDAGADQFIQKGNTEILISSTIALWKRIREIRSGGTENEMIIKRVGKFTFKSGSHLIRDETGKEIKLTPTEYFLIKYLLTKKTIDKREFSKYILDIDYDPQDRTFDNVLLRLRKKTGESIVQFDSADGMYRLKG